MRVNVYTEELLTGELKEPFAEIVEAKYISSRTNQPMTNYGLRIFLKSAPELHYIPGRDDDRSAVTFWCGPSKKNIPAFLETVQLAIEEWKRRDWGAKVEAQNEAAIAAGNYSDQDDQRTNPHPI